LKWQKIYGRFDKTNYEDHKMLVPNETHVLEGEVVAWILEANGPNRILLAGETNKVKPYIEQVLKGNVFTAGLEDVDYIWNFEDDPPTEIGKFNLIVSQATLEHLLNPYKHFSDLTSLLQPKGYLILHSVSPGFPYHRYPIDACRFFPDWFEETAKKLNLTVVKKREKYMHLFYMLQKPA